MWNPFRRTPKETSSEGENAKIARRAFDAAVLDMRFISPEAAVNRAVGLAQGNGVRITVTIKIDALEK